jgi:small multidrug resistance family-3 protein
MTISRAVALLAVSALLEMGGCWLIWQGLRDHCGLLWITGVLALGADGIVATFQPSNDFGRILAAYEGIFIVASLARGAVVDGYRPDRWDIIGAVICLSGVGVIMYGPRG